LYAPGKLTVFVGTLLPPPVTLICAHSTYTCAPGYELAACSAMSSCRRRYCPAGRHAGIVNETLPLFAMSVSTAHVAFPPDVVSPDSQILNHCRPVTVGVVAFETFAMYVISGPLCDASIGSWVSDASAPARVWCHSAVYVALKQRE
jgi:hypothetical protein